MTNALDGVYLMPGVTFSVAVSTKGNWPRLKLLPNGEIVASFYNHPSHGFGCGDIELWVSRDDGVTWQFRSQVSEHLDSPKLCRMNHASGLTARGELLVLVSGWSEGRQLPILPIQVSRSVDNGRTWERHILDMDGIPFGNVVLTPDGSLTCGMYHVSPRRSSQLHLSRDGGESWTPGHVFEVAAEGVFTSENALLRCRNGAWLSAVRTTAGGKLHLYRSEDDGLTWTGPTEPPMSGFPGNLLELNDGRVVLLAQQRDREPAVRAGVLGCVSADQGRTWSPYRTFLSTCSHGRADLGYPSSVQLPDGMIVTAYYWGGRAGEGKYGGRTDLPDSLGAPWHRPYHMGVMRWRAEDVFPA